MNDADKQRVANIFGKESYDELMQRPLEEERYEDDYDRLGNYNQRLEKIQREAAFPEVINEFRNNKEMQEPIDRQQYIDEAHAIDMQSKNYRQKKFKKALHKLPNNRRNPKMLPCLLLVGFLRGLIKQLRLQYR